MNEPIITQQNSRDYVVNVSIKRNFGSFGIKRVWQGEYRFCALANPHEASRIAAGNARVRSVSETVYTRITNVLPCDAVEVQG